MFGFFKMTSVKKANLGQSNTFYFNNDLKLWVERGKEAEACTKKVPNTPPRIKSPVKQVVQATGLAAKYVETGFGKPGAVASGFNASVFNSPNGIKTPTHDTKFFVPTLPTSTQAQNYSDGNAEVQGNDKGLISSYKKDSPVGSAEKMKGLDSPNAKIREPPVLDIFGQAEVNGETGSSKDRIYTIFGTQEGFSSLQTDKSKKSATNPVLPLDSLDTEVPLKGFFTQELKARMETVQTGLSIEHMPSKAGAGNELIIEAKAAEVELGGQSDASLPRCDNGTPESPVVAGINFDCLSNSLSTFSVGGQDLGREYGFVHQLHGLFVELDDLLKLLTPGSKDLAKQQAYCQEQVQLYMNSIETQKQIETKSELAGKALKDTTSQVEECMIQSSTSKLNDEREGTYTLQLELNKCKAELTEMQLSIESMTAEHKRAQNRAAMTLRAELNKTVKELERACETDKHKVIRLTESLEEARSKLTSAAEEIEMLRRKATEAESVKKHASSDECPSMKLMTSLGLAELQIKALSTKLQAANVDVDSLMSQTLGEFMLLEGNLL